jgi:hypothetical protein
MASDLGFPGRLIDCSVDSLSTDANDKRCEQSEQGPVHQATCLSVFHCHVENKTNTICRACLPFAIETAPKKYVTFHVEASKPKIGERVTVYYDPSQADHHGFWVPMKIEKVGKAGKGSKKY